MNRIDRLTAILIQLQSKKVVKAQEIADRFDITLRTVYRDVKALMEAGVPIGSEAGTGYFIVDGFHLPPVMFAQDEASAMLVAGKLVERMTDESVRRSFSNALFKIKSVLNEAQRSHLESLQAHVEVLQPHVSLPAQTGNNLSDLQRAIVSKAVLRVQYTSSEGTHTGREVEPIGLFYYSAAWHLIAWCRLRNGFRDFRCDRLQQVVLTGETFVPRSIFTLQQYFNSLKETNAEVISVVVLFDHASARVATNARHFFGFVSAEPVDDGMRMHFLTTDLPMMARWLLSYGSGVEVEEPVELRDLLRSLVEELQAHYLKLASS